jgi:hypothetical protein
MAIVFTPIAAFMAELFAARLRYTSMSLPFHLGAGWVAGFHPFGVAALNIYFGNLYPESGILSSVRRSPP